MKAYITNGITQDGFGARTQRAIYAMAFTYFLRDTYGVDIEYIHTPYWYEGFGIDYFLGESDRFIGDNQEPYDEIYRDGYLKRAHLWEQSLSLKCKKITDLSLEDLITVDNLDFDKSVLLNDLKNNTYQNKLYVVKYLQSEFNSQVFDINIIDTYYNDILNTFGFKKDVSNDIIIHIRRKDAYQHGSVRYIEDSFYLDLLKSLEPLHSKYNLIIHAQRKNFNHNLYEKYNVIYDDMIQDYEAFIQMVNSKILVTSKSSFSLCAGLLNNNDIVYVQQPSIKLSRWLDIHSFISKINRL